MSLITHPGSDVDRKKDPAKQHQHPHRLINQHRFGIITHIEAEWYNEYIIEVCCTFACVVHSKCFRIVIFLLTSKKISLRLRNKYVNIEKLWNKIMKLKSWRSEEMSSSHQICLWDDGLSLFQWIRGLSILRWMSVRGLSLFQCESNEKFEQCIDHDYKQLQTIIYSLTCHSYMVWAMPLAAADPAMPTNIGAPIFVENVDAPIWATKHWKHFFKCIRNYCIHSRTRKMFTKIMYASKRTEHALITFRYYAGGKRFFSSNMFSQLQFLLSPRF